MGIVISRYVGLMKMVVAGGDAAEMQDNYGPRSITKGGIYPGIMKRLWRRVGLKRKMLCPITGTQTVAGVLGAQNWNIGCLI